MFESPVEIKREIRVGDVYYCSLPLMTWRIVHRKGRFIGMNRVGHDRRDVFMQDWYDANQIFNSKNYTLISEKP